MLDATPMPVPEFTDYLNGGTLVRWVDGDTAIISINLPFRLVFEDSFRLFGIDTPERGQTGHDEAWAYARHICPEGSKVSVRTFKDADKYGRYLAVIGNGGPLAVNDELVLAGLAVLYAGGRKTPFVPTPEALAKVHALAA